MQKLSKQAMKNKMDYSKEFNKNNYDRISLVRVKGEREKINEYAKSIGMSTNEFINYCVDKELKTRGVDLYK